MPPRLVLRRTAIADLLEIADWINHDTPGRGSSYVEQIRTACGLWAENPLAGRDRSEISPGLRSFPHGNYVIFYRPRHDGISVIRVIHGKRDLQRM